MTCRRGTMAHPNTFPQLAPELYALAAIGPGDLFGEPGETKAQKGRASDVLDFTGPK
jgi:hypothetical protein